MKESHIKPLTYFFGLGTNLGDKDANLRAAIRLIGQRIGTVSALSSFYQTEPWGFSSPNTFLNAACRLQTTLSPDQVLDTTQAIERDMGRTLKSVDGTYHDRVIDIDLLLCYAADGTPVLADTPRLTLPHPLMHQRDFVLRPLAEIAPQVVHPLLKKTLAELLF